MFSCYLAANVINLSLLQSDPRWIDNLLSFQEWLAWISPEHFIRCRLYSLWSVALEILNWICNCNNKIGEFLIYLSCLDPALWAYNSWVHVIFISYFANLTPPHTNVIVTHCLILERKRSDAWPCFHPSVFGHILPMPGCHLSSTLIEITITRTTSTTITTKININISSCQYQDVTYVICAPHW